MSNNANLINQSSEEVEYYTPVDIIDAARECMGSIDLDPASCAIANQTVRAVRYFTKEDDGMVQPWMAKTLFMNHPFHRGEKACPTDRKKCKKMKCRPSRSKKKKTRGHHIDHDIPSNLDWINKFLSEYQAGHFEQGICITFANTSELWFRKLLPFAQCMPNKRIQYRNPDGTISDNVTKGSAITYLGPNVDQFAAAFRHIGTIKVMY
ncbi:hypothetical protein [Vibrio furnissii]|uniref:hypothetical protein n=1 Tax=Vibrio furnissii TaxID=29494 RepID=UPI001EEAE5BA|nr:hypothetical protein [Vibrio furnissii]MCG6216245.1 hypothetical protein [Vibrio furnissii]